MVLQKWRSNFSDHLQPGSDPRISKWREKSRFWFKRQMSVQSPSIVENQTSQSLQQKALVDLNTGTKRKSRRSPPTSVVAGKELRLGNDWASSSHPRWRSDQVILSSNNTTSSLLRKNVTTISRREVRRKRKTPGKIWWITSPLLRSCFSSMASSTHRPQSNAGSRSSGRSSAKQRSKR